MVDSDAALGEGLFKITLGDRVADAKKHRMKDHGLQIMHAYEIVHLSVPLAASCVERQDHRRLNRIPENFPTLPSNALPSAKP